MLNDLHAGLEWILKRAAAISRNSPADEDDLNRIVTYAGQIRNALTELHELQTLRALDERERAALSSLASRFWELEGRIKEIRNDRNRLPAGKAPEARPSKG